MLDSIFFVLRQRCNFIQKWVSCYLLFCFFIQCIPIHASDISVKSTSTFIDQSEKGTDIVLIDQPSQSGLSYNEFSSYNVADSGVVVNNSLGEGTTYLVGNMYANPFIESSAELIIFDVTGDSHSAINGYTEIFGPESDFILANRHGISINGGGFINVRDAVLTTGEVDFFDNNVSVSVDGGHIQIGAKGLDASDTESLTMASRSLSVDGPVIGGDSLDMIMGLNELDLDTREIVTQETVFDDPGIAIDGTENGLFVAGAIEIVSTEQGAGVYSQSDFYGTSDSITLDVNGHLSMNSVYSEHNISLHASGSLEKTGDTIAHDSVSIKSGQDVFIEGPSMIASQIDVKSEVDVFLSTDEEGAIVSDYMTIESDQVQLSNVQGQINTLEVISNQDISIHDSTIQSEKIKIDSNYESHIHQSNIYTSSFSLDSRNISQEEGVLYGDDIQMNGERIHLSGDVVSEELLSLESSQDILIEGHVEGVLDGNIRSDRLDLNGSLWLGQGGISVQSLYISEGSQAYSQLFDLGVGGFFINEGTLWVNGELDWDGVSFQNRGVLGAQNIKVKTDYGLDNQGGMVVSQGDMHVMSDYVLNHEGVIQTKGENSSGLLVIDVVSDIDNSSGFLSSKGDLNLSVGAELNNQFGVIMGDGMTIRLQKSLNNESGLLASDGQFLFQSSDLLEFDGDLIVNGRANLEGVSIHNKGSMYAQNGLFLTSDRDVINDGSLASLSQITMMSDAIQNSGDVYGEAGVYSQSETFHNQGKWVGGEISLASQVSFFNEGELASSSQIILVSDTIQNLGDVYGESGIYSQSETFQNQGKWVGENISLESQDSFLNEGELASSSQISMISESVQNSGDIQGESGVYSYSQQFHNYGQLRGDEMALESTEFFTNDGKLGDETSKTLSLFSEGDVINNGFIYSDNVSIISDHSIFNGEISDASIVANDILFLQSGHLLYQGSQGQTQSDHVVMTSEEDINYLGSLNINHSLAAQSEVGSIYFNSNQDKLIVDSSIFMESAQSIQMGYESYQSNNMTLISGEDIQFYLSEFSPHFTTFDIQDEVVFHAGNRLDLQGVSIDAASAIVSAGEVLHLNKKGHHMKTQLHLGSGDSEIYQPGSFVFGNQWDIMSEGSLVIATESDLIWESDVDDIYHLTLMSGGALDVGKLSYLNETGDLTLVSGMGDLTLHQTQLDVGGNIHLISESGDIHLNQIIDERIQDRVSLKSGASLFVQSKAGMIDLKSSLITADQDAYFQSNEDLFASAVYYDDSMNELGVHIYSDEIDWDQFESIDERQESLLNYEDQQCGKKCKETRSFQWTRVYDSEWNVGGDLHIESLNGDVRLTSLDIDAGKDVFISADQIQLDTISDHVEDHYLKTWYKKSFFHWKKRQSGYDYILQKDRRWDMSAGNNLILNSRLGDTTLVGGDVWVEGHMMVSSFNDIQLLAGNRSHSSEKIVKKSGWFGTSQGHHEIVIEKDPTIISVGRGLVIDGQGDLYIQGSKLDVGDMNVSMKGSVYALSAEEIREQSSFSSQQFLFVKQKDRSRDYVLDHEQTMVSSQESLSVQSGEMITLAGAQFNVRDDLNLSAAKGMLMRSVESIHESFDYHERLALSGFDMDIHRSSIDFSMTHSGREWSDYSYNSFQLPSILYSEKGSVHLNAGLGDVTLLGSKIYAGYQGEVGLDGHSLIRDDSNSHVFIQGKAVHLLSQDVIQSQRTEFGKRSVTHGITVGNAWLETAYQAHDVMTSDSSSSFDKIQQAINVANLVSSISDSAQTAATLGFYGTVFHEVETQKTRESVYQKGLETSDIFSDSLQIVTSGELRLESSQLDIVQDVLLKVGGDFYMTGDSLESLYSKQFTNNKVKGAISSKWSDMLPTYTKESYGIQHESNSYHMALLQSRHGQVVINGFGDAWLESSQIYGDHVFINLEGGLNLKSHHSTYYFDESIHMDSYGGSLGFYRGDTIESSNKVDQISQIVGRDLVQINVDQLSLHGGVIGHITDKGEQGDAFYLNSNTYLFSDVHESSLSLQSSKGIMTQFSLPSIRSLDSISMSYKDSIYQDHTVVKATLGLGEDQGTLGDVIHRDVINVRTLMNEQSISRGDIDITLQSSYLFNPIKEIKHDFNLFKSYVYTDQLGWGGNVKGAVVNAGQAIHATGLDIAHWVRGNDHSVSWVNPDMIDGADHNQIQSFNFLESERDVFIAYNGEVEVGVFSQSQQDFMTTVALGPSNALISPDIMHDYLKPYRNRHYQRNKLNNPLLATEIVSDSKNIFHRQGLEGKTHKKYISPDGHHEAIYDSSGSLVTDPLNMGTYNFASLDNTLYHGLYDVLPYFIWGNSQDDPSTIYDRVSIAIKGD